MTAIDGHAELTAPDRPRPERGEATAGEGRPLTAWRWYEWAATFALVAATVLATRDAWLDTLSIGLANEESNHILLVPFVFAWLFLVRRGRLRQCRVTPAGRWLGVGIAAAGLAMWHWGYYSQRHMPWHAGPILMAVGALVACCGKDVLVKFAPAFLVLVFLVHVAGPRRQQVAAPLQTVTANVTQQVSALLGMDVVRHGNVLNVGGTDVAVAEACNGMRMIVTLILSAYVFAFVTPLRLWVRLTIILLAPLMAVLANIARLVPTVFAYEHLSRELADTLHDLSGWAMLIGAFVALMGVVNLMRWAMLPVSPYRVGRA